MSTRSVNVIVSAKDRASSTLARIGHAAGGMGSMFRKAALAATAYFGTRQIIRWSRESLAAYGVQEEAQAKLAQALEATGGAAGISYNELLKFAAGLQQTTKFGDEAVITTMSILATFKQIKGGTFKQATEAVLDMSEALGQDLKSSVIQLGKALNDPVLGLTALGRVGINFSDGQKKQIKTMVKFGDVLGAQKVILAELNSQFGGQAAAAAKTFAGAIAQMKNALGDLKEKIGFALRPFVHDWAVGIKEWAENNQEKISGWVFNVVNAAKLTKDVLADFVDYMKTDWWSGMAWAFDSFLAIMKTTFTSAVTLAIVAGKGIGKAFKDHILGGKSGDINKKMSEIIGTTGNWEKYRGAMSVEDVPSSKREPGLFGFRGLYSLARTDSRHPNAPTEKELVWNKESADYKALHAEAEKRYIAEQTKNIIGQGFETIADGFKKTFKEIAESAPTALSDAAKKRRAEYQERLNKFLAGEGAPVTIGSKRSNVPGDDDPAAAAKGGGGRIGLAPVQTGTMTIEPGFIFGPQKQTAENTRGILIESQKQTAILSRNPGNTSGPDSTGTRTGFIKYAEQAVGSLTQIVNILRDSQRSLDKIKLYLNPTGRY